MKRIVTLFALVAAASLSYGQGRVSFGNTSTTLISYSTTEASAGAAIPGSSTSAFVFGLFLAPSDTVTSPVTPGPLNGDALWQNAVGYNVNHATAAGRLATTAGQLVVSDSNYGGGSTADFIVRGWSANLGSTWSDVLLSLGGSRAFTGDPYLGVSRIANNVVLGDGGSIPTPALFGVGANQVGGFTMYLVPEPSTFALAGLGAAALLIFRRRK